MADACRKHGAMHLRELISQQHIRTNNLSNVMVPNVHPTGSHDFFAIFTEKERFACETGPPKITGCHFKWKCRTDTRRHCKYQCYIKEKGAPQIFFSAAHPGCFQAVDSSAFPTHLSGEHDIIWTFSRKRILSFQAWILADPLWLPP